MLKDMQSQYGPNPNLPKTDTLAGEGKKNAG